MQHWLKSRQRTPLVFFPFVVRDCSQGKKIIGSAQRRLSGAFLQHGSILMDFDPCIEAKVIPGARVNDLVTSIKRELGYHIPLKEVMDAFANGFTATLGIELRK
jgi:lipoate-protein ligase A